ncbi:MAG: glycosyltransferase family 4 protein [Planctomycetota bacterium]|nr:MAG: glycosyltransferase family 4 protein [Planctomycetota bacterium]
MNICHVITRLIVGGAQENTLLTCEGLRAKGHQVTLITGPDSGPEGSLLAEARAGGYEVRVLPTLRRAIKPLADLRAWRSMASVFAEIKPDVVHTHSSKAGILGRLAAHSAGVPIVVHTIHGMSFNRTQCRLVQGLYRKAEQYCGRFTDRFICVADAMTDQAVAAGLAAREKFVTVYSGMRTEWYDPTQYKRGSVRQSWGFADDAIVVCTVARLFRDKGYEQLIPTMAAAVERVPKLRFVWVGDGAQREVYERRLEELGLRSHVHLTGLLSPAKVPEVLAGADILVHASQWEGLPRTAVQALLMQCPVISFDIDGAPEVVVEGKTGKLVPLNDIDRLTEAMVSLAGDAEGRKGMGAAGRELCLKRFDHNVMVDAIEKVYRELHESG